MDQFLRLSVAFFVLSLVFWVLEGLFAANRGWPRIRKDMKTDLVYWLFTPVFTKTLTGFGIALTLVLIYRESPAAIKEILNARDTWATRLPAAVQIPMMLFAGDFVSYWMHRLFHGRALWKFHAVHHSSRQLDWLSSVRLHPINDLLTRWIQVSALLLAGFSPKAAAAYLPFLSFYGILLHANVTWSFGWLGQVFASPRFHRWHHTSQEEGMDRNFAGLFPVLDRIFGTYYMPEGSLPQEFGIKGHPVPDGFLAQMAYPFRR